MIPLDSTTHAGLDINAVLGAEALPLFQDATDAYLAALPDETQREWYTPNPDPANWTLLHQRGRWQVKGRLEGADESVQGRFADLPLTLPLPQTLLGKPPTTLAWNDIVRMVPTARDAVLAPDRSWMVILHANRLTVHMVRQAIISQAFYELPLPRNAEVVMEQWAVPPRLRVWNQHMERLASVPTPTP